MVALSSESGARRGGNVIIQIGNLFSCEKYIFFLVINIFFLSWEIYCSQTHKCRCSQGGKCNNPNRESFLLWEIYFSQTHKCRCSQGGKFSNLFSRPKDIFFSNTQINAMPASNPSWSIRERKVFVERRKSKTLSTFIGQPELLRLTSSLLWKIFQKPSWQYFFFFF